MSQFNINVIPEVDDGVSLSEQINSWRDAVHSAHVGPQRPSYAVAGTVWIDNSVVDGWKMYVYDGTKDIPLPGPIQSTGAGAGGAIAYMEGFNNQYAAFGSASSHPTVIATNKTEVARFTEAGDFGVGTNNPIVRGDFHGIDYTAIRAYATTNAVDARIQALGSASKGFVGTISNHPFAVVTNNAERITVTTAGNVGIGTTAPNYKLTVVSDQSDYPVQFISSGTGVSADAIISVKTSGSGSTQTVAGINFGDADSETVGRISYDHSNDSMRFFASGAEQFRTLSGSVLFGKGASDLTAAGVDIRTNLDYGRINFVKNTTSGTGSTVSCIFYYAGTTVGSIGNTSTATTYATTSDYRLKENVAPMTGALEKIAQLKPCTYTWKSDGSASQGFIAHELQEIFPDAVTGEKDAVETVDDLDAEGRKIGTKEVPSYQGVDTSFLVAALVAAVQELTAKVAALEAK